MAETSTFLAWAESLDTLSYYEILRVDERASTAEIQQSFHDISLRCHPDRFVVEGPEVAKAAGSVFKRAAEAYGVLRRPDLRRRYDEELKKKGAVKFDEQAVATKKLPEQRTLYMIAKGATAKQYAAKADALISKGELDAARIQLISATQHDPMNEELKERLEILYEALLLEPGDFL